MNLPIVIDIAIGLIFIYLTFSLLASELQELLSTLLQWRAVHLKQSIEGFLSGNAEERWGEAHDLANRLYDHPAIRTLNHEAKGVLAKAPRLLTRLIPTRIFGQHSSGPSYIGADIFASGLLQTLGLDRILQKLTVQRMEHQLAEMVGQLDYPQVRDKLRSSLQAYEKGAMTLDAVVDQAGYRIREVNQAIFEQYFSDSSQRPYLTSQLSVQVTDILQASYLYLSLSWRAQLCRRALQLVERRGKADTAAIQEIRGWLDVPRSLRPTLVVLAVAWMQKRREVNIKAIAQLPNGQLKALGVSADDLKSIPQAELFYKSFFVFEQAKQAIEGKTALGDVEQAFRTLRSRGDLPSYFDNTLDQTLDTLALILTNGEVKAIVDRIPLGLLEGLQTPARKVQTQLDSVGAQLESFQREIANWFERSMERAGGVYKRNARLVSFCLGLGIAVVANVDTLHMVDHLTQAQALESTVASLVDKIDNAQAFTEEGLPSQIYLRQLSEQVYPELPVGWGPKNLELQALRDGTVQPSESTEAHQKILVNPLDRSQGGGIFQFALRRLFGWLITGLAISMGAAFWYDLLGKFIQIRNVGKKPPTSPSIGA